MEGICKEIRINYRPRVIKEKEACLFSFCQNKMIKTFLGKFGAFLRGNYAVVLYLAIIFLISFLYSPRVVGEVFLISLSVVLIVSALVVCADFFQQKK